MDPPAPIDTPPDDLRRSPRVQTTNVRCPLGDIIDLSRTGMRARSPKRPAIVEGHALRFLILTAGDPIDVSGTVVWIRRAHRFTGPWDVGVRFDGVTPAIESRLAALVGADKPKPRAEAQIEDLYAILEVSPGASTDDIRESFRRLAMLYHPDRSELPDAADRFERLHKSYRVLRDPSLRARYDALRRDDRRAA